MTAKNRTSSKHKKPGVYVDQARATQESQTKYAAQQKARKFQALRGANKAAAAAAPAAAAAAAAPVPALTNHHAALLAASAGDDAQSDEEDGAEQEQDASAGDAAAAAAAALVLPAGLTPFVSSDSASISISESTESSLKDERLLGVALWEWLLAHPDWDCHTLWEAFLRDWDLITETERPPGTNRPVNLHGYLTYLRAPNNKTVVRRDVRTSREILLREREAHLAAHPEDPRALPSLRALQGSLLSYALKMKNLVPFESAAQKKRQEAKKRKLEHQQAAAAAAGKDDAAAAAEGEGESAAAGADDAVVEPAAAAPQQPKRKRGKHAHAQGAPPSPTLTAAAQPATAAAPAARPPAEKLALGRPSAFAALLDCD